MLLLFLALLAPLGGAGCGLVPGLGPQISVADTAPKALAEGAAKEALARKAADARQVGEASRLYNEAAAYYGAVASRYVGSETAARALLAQARLQDEALENPTLALSTLRNLLKQYPSTLNAEALNQFTRLQQKMDAQSAKTVPYKLLDGVVRALGNNPRYSHVLTIFLISLGVTLALWPLRAKQYRAMKEMQRYQPELKKIQERYKEDRGLQQEKVMAFYKEHGVNPFGGCLPSLAQMPVLWGLYYAISQYQFQFAKATFLWVNPAAAAASTTWPQPLTGAIARNLGEQDLLLLFVYAVSMYFQTKLTPVSDPAQAEQQKIMAVFMPVMFFVMMLQWHLPSAFVLYWFMSNVMFVAQQWWINHKIGTLPPFVLPDPAPAAASGNGAVISVRPSNGGSNGTNNGGGAKSAAAPLSANPRLVSPKNRKRK